METTDTRHRAGPYSKAATVRRRGLPQGHGLLRQDLSKDYSVLAHSWSRRSMQLQHRPWRRGETRHQGDRCTPWSLNHSISDA